MSIEPNKFNLATHETSREREAAPVQGNWFHRNRWFTKEPITYTGYQFFRSAMAAVPYGFGMAGVHRAMGYLGVVGQRIGLTPEGIEKANTAAGLAAVDMDAAFHLPGRRAALGRGLTRVATSPLNQALQIGVGFTMFRFVGGLVKGQRDKVMNEHNTAEDTNRESKNWWQNIKQMAKTNWVAEATGTPIAALTLGFASANFKPIASAVAKKQMLPGGAVETFGQAYERAVFSPNAKLAQNAAIWTIAYSIFFEASERIFKDMQLKRGKWLGNTNSLKNTPDDPNVGGYAADGHTHEFHQNVAPPKPKLDILTGDPSICRFLFRRVLPVSVGITGYAMMKRGGYIAAGGPMHFVGNSEISKGVAHNAKTFLGDSWREGLATATFGALWMATDAWGSWYDKFFANLQDKAGHKPLNDHQSKHLADLHEKLQQKETAHGRVA